MKTILLKSNILLAALLVLNITLKAQQSTTTKTYGSQKQVYGNSKTQTYGKPGEEHITTERSGKTYQLEFADGKMTAFSIDGETIPADKWSEYNTLINEIREQIKKDREQAEKDRQQAKLDREQADRDRLQANKDREQAKLDKVQADKDRTQSDRDREQAMRDKLQAEKDRMQADRDREQAGRDRMQAEKDRQQADRDREQAARDRVQAEKDRAQAAADRKLLNDLMTDLVNDKLVTAQADVRELMLNHVGMSINGQKQPDEVWKKYMDKYSRFAKNGLSYRISGDGENRSIQMQMNN